MHTYGEPIPGTREVKVRKIEPAIKPYDQDRWAALTDARTLSVAVSLALLRPLQLRLAATFSNARPEDWWRAVHIPSTDG